MEENENHLGKIPELAKLTTYSIFIAILFGVIQVHLYYHIFLHIPIFNYIETSEVILLSGSTGVSLMIYFLGVNLPVYFIQQNSLNRFQKISTVLISYTLAGLYFWLAFRNDAIIREFTLLPIRNWWIIGFLLIFLLAFNTQLESTKRFMSKHKIYQPILLAVWMGLFTGYSNFSSLTNSNQNTKLSLKLKSGSVIKTSDNLIYAGRIQNYWFFYNRKTAYTRVFKNDDVDIADFDSKHK